MTDDPLNQCPRCQTFDTVKQMTDWVPGGIDIVYTCSSCDIDFVTSLRHPMKEVVHEYGGEPDDD